MKTIFANGAETTGTIQEFYYESMKATQQIIFLESILIVLCADVFVHW